MTSGAHFDTQIAAAIKRGAAKNVFALPRGILLLHFTRGEMSVGDIWVQCICMGGIR